MGQRTVRLIRMVVQMTTAETSGLPIKHFLSFKLLDPEHLIPLGEASQVSYQVTKHLRVHLHCENAKAKFFFDLCYA